MTDQATGSGGPTPGGRARGRRLGAALRRFRALRAFALTSQLVLWPIGVVVGVATGYAVIIFMSTISAIQTFIYGADDLVLHSVAASLPWYVVLIAPVAGGLAVGLILHRCTPDGRARGVADVIRAAALRKGSVERREGGASALAALITLSTGGSTGREGPAVHIGAVIASWINEKLNVPAISGRDILGCAAAAAVSASFNAPIAGTIFALEVILRHYALHSFGPITVAAVSATIVSRIHLGDVTEFTLPVHTLDFYWEIPAFIMLGAVCGVFAAVKVEALFFADRVGDRVQRALGIPNWLRPACAGLLLGMIAIPFPHIIGVGYETTSLALTSQIAFFATVVFALVKVLAVTITYAGRMGGGVFSPAIMFGALTGSAFGAIAIDVFPSVAGSQGLYALAGMGAMAGAVLGAPISSTLIVFELTGDYQAAIAVMISVSMASIVSDRLGARSVFLCQLEHSGLNLHVGPQGYLAATMPVMDLMRPRGADDGASDTQCWELYEQGAWLDRYDTLDRALPMFETLKTGFLPIMETPQKGPGGRQGARPEIVGALYARDALRAYTRVLEEELREEHV